MKGCYNHNNEGEIIGKRTKDWINNTIVNSELWKSNIWENDYVILDIGSGSGRLNEVLLPYAYSITNIEPNIDPFDKFLYNNTVWFKKYFEDFVEYNNSKFDLITFFFSFYIMKNKKFVLKSCLEMLKGPGKIFIAENIQDITVQNREGYYPISTLEDFCKENNMNYNFEYIKQEPESIICILEKN